MASASVSFPPRAQEEAEDDNVWRRQHHETEATTTNTAAPRLPPTSPLVMRRPRRKMITRSQQPTENNNGVLGTPTHALSPMKDDKKKQYQRKPKRVPRSAEKLEAMLSTRGLPPVLVEKMISELFQEQEMDDRDMYRVSLQAAKEQTQCERSQLIDELSSAELRRMLTYGEVSVASVSKTILPFLRLEADDVFYDLGCGTGKIVIQAALETPCRVSKGIELMQNRVVEGQRALKRLQRKRLENFSTKSICIVQGDICQPPPAAPMLDATVVFINNVCFGPELMLRVMDMLNHMPQLKRVVTLRKICERHRHQKCARAGNFCMDYVHPPREAEIQVSWANKTSVYVYDRIDYSVRELATRLQFTQEAMDMQD